MECIKNYRNNNSTLFLLFICFYLILIYINTLESPFMFDDRVHILERKELHLTDLTLNSIYKTFFIEKTGAKELYRPLSCLTFALNYYFGRTITTGYHIVNIAIHIITTIFLFKTMTLLLSLPNNNLGKKQTILIAGLATILWAAHPIQTQAVTYIIQRMAALATMFYIIGLFFYIKFRIKCQANISKSINSKWLVFSLLSFIMAVLSKQNASLFPVAILLVELFFFDGHEKLKRNPRKTLVVSAVLLSLPFLIAILFNPNIFHKILSIYSDRPFTLKQRLLTEPRVILFYISQLFYPVPERFSLVHSFSLSHSLFSPISTFLAILIIAATIIFSFWTCKRYPLIGFSITFYFFHHLIESTFLPLELVYEHRNYLPSLFFFLPISLGLVKLLIFYKTENKRLFYTFFLFSLSIVFFLGFATHLRNKDWKSAALLWRSAVKKTPGLARSFHGFGLCYTDYAAPYIIDDNKAIFFLKKATEKKISYNIFEKAFIWLDIANYYKKKNNLTNERSALLKSLEIFETKISKNPQILKKRNIATIFANNYSRLAENLFFDDIDKALFYLKETKKFKNLLKFYNYNLEAYFLIVKGEYEAALEQLQICLQKGHDNWKTFLLLGHVFTFRNDFSKGAWFYKLALNQARGSEDISYGRIYLYMAENRYLIGKNNLADNYLNLFFHHMETGDIIQYLSTLKREYSGKVPLINKAMVLKKVSEKLHKLAETIN